MLAPVLTISTIKQQAIDKDNDPVSIYRKALRYTKDFVNEHCLYVCMLLKAFVTIRRAGFIDHNISHIDTIFGVSQQVHCRHTNLCCTNIGPWRERVVENRDKNRDVNPSVPSLYFFKFVIR